MGTWPVDADVVHGKALTKVQSELPNVELDDVQIRVRYSLSISYLAGCYVSHQRLVVDQSRI